MLNSPREAPGLEDCFGLQEKAQGRVPKAYPDFKRVLGGDGLWVDSKGIPAWAIERLNSGEVQWEKMDPPQPPKDVEALWKSLFEHPTEWEDFREDKAAGERSERFPDFKHYEERDTGLWIDSKDTPQWVQEKIQNFTTIVEEARALGPRALVGVLSFPWGGQGLAASPAFQSLCTGRAGEGFTKAGICSPLVPADMVEYFGEVAPIPEEREPWWRSLFEALLLSDARGGMTRLDRRSGSRILIAHVDPRYQCYRTTKELAPK